MSSCVCDSNSWLGFRIVLYLARLCFLVDNRLFKQADGGEPGDKIYWVGRKCMVSASKKRLGLLPKDVIKAGYKTLVSLLCMWVLS